jgi:poly-gamma-glutamate synthesis protein (capsule biosynthesis protein)
MTGRGLDQILPHPCDPVLHESYVKSARDYVRLAEQVNGRIPRAVKFSSIWGAALQELTRMQPDARIINLETSITRRGAFVPKGGINYRMSPKNAVCLVSADIECCVLANNHILDWGHAGLFDTLESLERLWIESAGAGLDMTSGVPVTWAARSGTPVICLLTYLSDASVAWIAERVGRLRRTGDVVVLSIHWGKLGIRNSRGAQPLRPRGHRQSGCLHCPRPFLASPDCDGSLSQSAHLVWMWRLLE